MKIKTADLIGKMLDWAVAKADGKKPSLFLMRRGDQTHRYSVSWIQAGPIIDREHIDLSHQEEYGYVTASIFKHGPGPGEVELVGQQDGPNALVAAMRAFVESRLGEEVEIPDELVEVPA